MENFLGDWRRTHYSSQISPKLDGKKVILFGWVEGIRDLGGIKFITLRDKEGLSQVTISRDITDNDLVAKADLLQKQYVIGVKGKVKRMKNAPGGVEIIPSELKILAQAKHPLPLDPTGRVPADIEVRLNARVLDLRRPESRAIFKIRHVITEAIREFFHSRGYLEVTTPKIIASATEGGAALFPIAYYDREAFLAQSPQLYKEQLASDFEKVFEIGPIYRAEESNTTRHVSEAYSVDIEEAFVTYDDIMSRLEEMVCYVIKVIKTTCKKEFAILKKEVVVPKRPFKRYTYTEILEELKSKGVDISWGEDITTPAFRVLSESHPTFYFIKDWPTKAKPFYVKPKVDDSKVCESFDLMYGWLELTSGGTRVDTKDLLTQRLLEQGLNPSSFEFHLNIYSYGMPPHAGFGLGLDRLTMVLTGRDNVRETILFPRDRLRLTP
jgi:aspartyl-tRNA synthetase